MTASADLMENDPALRGREPASEASGPYHSGTAAACIDRKESRGKLPSILQNEADENGITSALAICIPRLAPEVNAARRRIEKDLAGRRGGSGGPAGPHGGRVAKNSPARVRFFA
ncbi:MAG: hypothetical protein IJL69_05895, partial [Oscillospiraceae bacterium]|nr:hypothetical protein [Oscillospiraceae bacterium]